MAMHVACSIQHGDLRPMPGRILAPTRFILRAQWWFSEMRWNSHCLDFKFYLSWHLFFLARAGLCLNISTLQVSNSKHKILTHTHFFFMNLFSCLLRSLLIAVIHSAINGKVYIVFFYLYNIYIEDMQIKKICICWRCSLKGCLLNK